MNHHVCGQVIHKFVAVKFVLFFSFWQSVFLSMLASGGFIQDTEYFTVQNISSQIQNFLICLEMVIASGMHVTCFASTEYEGSYRTNFVRGIRDVIIAKDLINDTKNAMKMKRKDKAGKSIEMDTLKSSFNSSRGGAGKGGGAGIGGRGSMNQMGADADASSSTNINNHIHAQKTSNMMLGADSFGELSRAGSENQMVHHEKSSLMSGAAQHGHGGNGNGMMGSLEASFGHQNQLNHGESDLGELGGRRESIDTNPDIVEDEMDEDFDGVGIIRLNPKIDFEQVTLDEDEQEQGIHGGRKPKSSSPFGFFRKG